MTNVESWGEYQRLVLQELEYHHTTLEELKNQISTLRVELAVLASHSQRIETLETSEKTQNVQIATLNVKAGLWGGAAGILTAIAAALLHFIK